MAAVGSVQSYKIQAVLSATDRGFTRTLKSAAKQAESLIGKVSAGLGGAFKTVGKAGAAQLAELGAFTVKTGADFEATMSKIAAIGEMDIYNNEEDKRNFEELTRLAEEMGRTTKFSATESAEALQYMAQAGWEPTRMMGSLEGVMDLAAASGEDLAQTSSILTNTMQAFRLGMGDAAVVARDTTMAVDVLAKAASSSNTDVSSLGESFEYVAPMAGTLGYSIQDTAVALGLMANNGIKGGEAGTALRGALTALTKPTDEATEMMDSLGISITNSDGSMKDLRTVMTDLRGSFSDLSAEQKAQAATAIFGKQAMSGMLSIINASDEDFNKLTGSIDNSSGAAKNMSKIMSDNLKGDFTQLMSAVSGFGIEAFRSMGGLRKLVQKATEVVGNLTERVRDFSRVFTDTTATTEEKLQAFKTLVEPLVPLSVLLGAALAGLGILHQKYGDEIDTMLETAREKGPELITKIVAGIRTKLPEMIASGGELVRNLLDTLRANAPALINGGIDIVLDLAQGFSDELPSIMGKAGKLIGDVLNTIGNRLPELLKTGADIVTKLMDGITNNLDEILPAVGKIIGNLLQGFVDNFPDILEAGLNLLLGIVEGITNNLPEIVIAAGILLGRFILTLIKNLPKIIRSGIDLIIALIKGLGQGLLSLGAMGWELIKELIAGLVNGWDQKIVDLWNKITGWFENIGEKIGGFFADIWRDIRGVVDEEGEEIVLAFNDMGDAMITTSENMTDKVVVNIEALPDELVEVLESATIPVDQKMQILMALLEEGTDPENVLVNFGMIKQGALDELGAMTMGTNELSKESMTHLTTMAADIGTFGRNAVLDVSSTTSDIKAEFGSVQDAADNAVDMSGPVQATNDGVDEILGDLEGTKEAIPETFEEGYSSATPLITEGYENLEAEVKAGEERLRTKHEESKDRIEKRLEEHNDSIVRTTKEGGEEVVSYAQKSLGDLADKHQGAEPEITSSAKSISDGVVRSFDSLPGDLTAVGAQAMQGLKSGLRSNSDNVFAEASAIARNIAATLRSVLRIQSPSKVMARIGGYVGEGLVVGMEGMQRGIRSEALTLAESITEQLDGVESEAYRAGQAIGAGLNDGIGTTRIEALPDLSPRPSGIRNGRNSGLRGFDGITPQGAAEKPLELILELGGRSWRAFVDDITDEQDRRIKLEAYHV